MSKQATATEEIPLGAQYDLLESLDEKELTSSLNSLLGRHATWQDVLARTEMEPSTDLDLWRRIAVDQGLAGLAIPEELGGAGASWREVGVVMEQLGKYTAPVPYLGSAVLATAALLQAGANDLLGQLADGSTIATLVVPFTSAPGTPYQSTVKVSSDKLTGTVPVVADALCADVLIVPTANGLYSVAASDATIEPTVTLDMTRQLADITLDGAAGTKVGDDAAAAVDRALIIGAAMLACEQVGIAQNALDTALNYMKGRYQFGRLIGSYQALKHRMADVYVSVTQIRAAAKYAAACAGADDADLPIAAAVAKAHASPLALKAAEECQQMHGGQGMTWENPSHLMLKRAKADSMGLGRADQVRQWLGTLIEL